MDSFEAVLAEIADLFAWAPDWITSLVAFALAVLVALAIHRVLFRILTRLTADKALLWRSLVSRLRGPARLGILILAFVAASSLAPLAPNDADVVRHGLLIGLMVLVGWMAHSALNIWTTVHLRRFKLDTEDNLLARKHVTQTRILRRIGSVLIGTITVAAALMTFDSVRQYGVSLLASAGAAGLIAGLALQPVLKNIFAGIQLAITQPIRIDDALIVEGEWGNVEEITSTYVVVRTWDWRRLILPLSYFMERPFQNWTREGSQLIGTVMIYVDYSVPLAALRQRAKEVVERSGNWDRQVLAVQVTDCRERTMEVRILASASNAGRAFDLRCEIREQVVDFLQREHPSALPRLRADLVAAPANEEHEGTRARAEASA
jgi:small-conductance mechanosensitive channel